jgi:hypothetical protein
MPKAIVQGMTKSRPLTLVQTPIMFFGTVIGKFLKMEEI